MKLFNIFKSTSKVDSIFYINPNFMIIDGLDDLLDIYQYFTIDEKKKLSLICDVLTKALSSHRVYLEKIGKFDRLEVEKSSFEIIILYWITLTNHLQKKSINPQIAKLFYDITYYSILKRNKIKETIIIASLNEYDKFFQNKCLFYIDLLKMLPNSTLTGYDYLSDSIIENPFKLLNFKEVSNKSFINSIMGGMTNKIEFIKYYNKLQMKIIKRLEKV